MGGSGKKTRETEKGRVSRKWTKPQLHLKAAVFFNSSWQRISRQK